MPPGSNPVVYAIADTHLGLREHGPGGHSDQPVLVADFLRWLSALPPGGTELAVLEGPAVARRRLLPATHLVLLGDIIELWDSENPSVLLSSVPVKNVLAGLSAEKVYVLGNHDNVLETAAGSYPVGDPPMTIVRDVYPEPDEVSGHVQPLRIGSRDFIFLHGHQFDLHFVKSGGTWRILGHLRQFGAALGGYAWSFAALWLAVLTLQLATPAPPAGWFLVLGLALPWIPRFYMTVARRAWKSLAGTRYDREGAFRGFRSWWRLFHTRLMGAGDLGIVYGHTHYLDWVESAHQALADGKTDKAETELLEFLARGRAGRFALFNLSSWVSTQGLHKAVMNATIFYADDGGPLFLGWDWRARRPFHIPFEFVAKRRSRFRLDPVDAAIVERLGWPRKLIEKWRTTDEDV